MILEVSRPPQPLPPRLFRFDLNEEEAKELVDFLSVNPSTRKAPNLMLFELRKHVLPF